MKYVDRLRWMEAARERERRTAILYGLGDRYLDVSCRNKVKIPTYLWSLWSETNDNES